MAGHIVFVPPEQEWPARHGVHELAPAALKLPDAQLTQDSLPPGEYVPAGQTVDVPVVVHEYPARHSVQDEAPAVLA